MSDYMPSNREIKRRALEGELESLRRREVSKRREVLHTFLLADCLLILLLILVVYIFTRVV